MWDVIFIVCMFTAGIVPAVAGITLICIIIGGARKELDTE